VVLHGKDSYWASYSYFKHAQTKLSGIILFDAINPKWSLDVTVDGIPRLQFDCTCEDILKMLLSIRPIIRYSDKVFHERFMKQRVPKLKTS